MEEALRELIGTVQQPFLRLLLERLVGRGAALWPAYRDAPAAKFYHQAYRHGLLEHCLAVGQAVSAISATFAGIDRDLALLVPDTETARIQECHISLGHAVLE